MCESERGLGISSGRAAYQAEECVLDDETVNLTETGCNELESQSMTRQITEGTYSLRVL